MPPRLRIALLLFLATIALNLRTVGYSFVWDDRFQINGNPSVTNGAPWADYFLDASTTTSQPEYNSRVYRPLRNITFRLLAIAFGVRPEVFRVATLSLQEDSSLSTFLDGAATAPVALVGYFGIMLAPLGHRLSYLKPNLCHLLLNGLTPSPDD